MSNPISEIRMPILRSLGLIGLCVLAGCGSDSPALPPVSGTVLMDGKPLAGAHIRFVPQGDTLGHGGAGDTELVTQVRAQMRMASRSGQLSMQSKSPRARQLATDFS